MEFTGRELDHLAMCKYGATPVTQAHRRCALLWDVDQSAYILEEINEIRKLLTLVVVFSCDAIWPTILSWLLVSF